MQRVIKVTPYQIVFGKEMRRYEILPVVMREEAQVKEEAIEEDAFDISDTEEQLLLNQIRHIELRTSPIPDSSHSSPELQHSNRDPTNNFLDQNQQQRYELHEVAHQNQVHANRRAVKGYSKHYTITIFKEGDHVSIAVPAHDRGPTDSKRIFGKVLNVDESKPDCYQVITAYGVLNRLFPIKDLLLLPATISLNIPSK
ncbi:MAG: hypothetical protein M1839_001667 [Geoglossum umbratile]|nr:MAG: hypothetical protein M1839_001667 [Geoglossum umbratile]